MSKIPELETLCPVHQVKISAACFYEGCTQLLLCRKCYKEHPEDHDSDIKDIVDLINDKSWIEAIEGQKKPKLVQIEGIHQQKKELIMENERLLNEFVQSIIASLEAQKELWLREISHLVNFSDQQERELDGNLALLTNFDFTGDAFEKINKAKSFQDNVLLNARQLIENIQSHLEKGKVDKEKIEEYKIELTGILQRLCFKHFMVHEPFKSLTFYEERVALEEEYKRFKGISNTKIEGLSQKIEDLISENTRLQNELNEAIEAKRHLESDYEKEAAELERIKKSLPLEDSKIMQAADFATLKEWIPKSFPSNKVVLRLIYRASRDGWGAHNFHSKCDGIAPTILVIKSQGHGRVFGGYTTKSWGLNKGYTEDKDAFIFSLTQGEKYPCIFPSKAISSDSQHMIIFGGHDISIRGEKKNYSYDGVCQFPTGYACSHFSTVTSESPAYLAGGKLWDAEELEVYQIHY